MGETRVVDGKNVVQCDLVKKECQTCSVKEVCDLPDKEVDLGKVC
mgnify:CR=1 FL=1